MSDPSKSTAYNGARHKKRSRFPEIWRRFKKNKLAVMGLIVMAILVLIGIFADSLAPYPYQRQHLADKFTRPGSKYLLGADNFGRDILSRVMYGARISLSVGFIAVGIGLLGGGILGAVAAYYGKWVDMLIMRTMDIMMSVPNIVLAVAVCAALGPGIGKSMIAIGISAIPTYARIVRAAVLTTVQQDFIEAARAIGASNNRILMRHIMPNCLAPIIVQATSQMAYAILSIASLSFIGLGVQPPTPEWGSMLSAARPYMRVYQHMVFPSGLAILLTVFSLNMLGDGLRDALDPRLKK